ncbi:MAG: hypothetical protein IRY92_00525 [Dactylosporangium sp.]|nr:hypothetical protein [Dactylosporangium sp.]
MNASQWPSGHEAQSESADLYIVAEHWEVATDWVRGDIADGAMNYPLRDLILRFVADRTLSATAFADGVHDLWRQLPTSAIPGMLDLLGSHDTERLLTRCHGDRRRLRQALAPLVTSPGVPMIYYGDEVGLTGGNDPGCRGCMPWDFEQWDTEVLDMTGALLATGPPTPDSSSRTTTSGRSTSSCSSAAAVPDRTGSSSPSTSVPTTPRCRRRSSSPAFAPPSAPNPVNP